MATDTQVQYEIAVTRTGEGASLAVADFKMVEAAAARANATMNNSTATVAAVTATTKTATSSLRAMQGTMTLIGAQTFPKLTLAATTAQTAFAGIRTAAAAAGVGVASMGAGITVAVAGIMLAIKAGIEFKNMMSSLGALKKSDSDYLDQVKSSAASMRENIMQRVADGRLNLSPEDAETLDRLLSQPSNDRLRMAREMVQSKMPVGEFMSEGERNAAAQQRIKDLGRSMAYSDAAINFGNPEAATNKAYQQINIQSQYNDQVKLFNTLRQESLITETQLRDLTIEADTARMNALAELRQQATALQELERRSAEMFAAGFSQAFAEVIAGTKSASDAFRSMMSELLSQVAQMLMTMAIMRALFGATGLSTGTGGLIGGLINGAARGGMFPRMAASGLTGVESVSSATYFPRFNVVAGEAGREMLTVLARPRMMEVGGVQAVVGSAQGNRLAITSADALAGAGSGAGGGVLIRVSMEPGLRGEIVQQSVKGAQVQIANDMRQDTPISRGVKGLTS